MHREWNFLCDYQYTFVEQISVILPEKIKLLYTFSVNRSQVNGVKLNVKVCCPVGMENESFGRPEIRMWVDYIPGQITGNPTF